MRVSKIFSLAFLAFVLAFTTMTDFAEARRGGGGYSGGRSSSRGSSSRSTSRSSGWGRSSRNYYTGVIIIANPGGGYYSGYGDQCFHGCAIDQACGTAEQCQECLADGSCMSDGGSFWTFLLTICAIICAVGCCIGCVKLVTTN